MLVELEIVDDPERVGFYSGIIVSAHTRGKDFVDIHASPKGIRLLSRKSCHQSVIILAKIFCPSD
jgi:hypothetical protein